MGPSVPRCTTKLSWQGSRRCGVQAEVVDRLADTGHGWESWSQLHQSYQGPWQELVEVSGRVLQGLTYYPTGAELRRQPRGWLVRVGTAVLVLTLSVEAAEIVTLVP